MNQSKANLFRFQLILTVMSVSLSSITWGAEEGAGPVGSREDGNEKAVIQAESLTKTMNRCLNPECTTCRLIHQDAPKCGDDLNPVKDAPATAKLSCSSIGNKDALAAIEAFLRGHAGDTAKKEEIAKRAAKILGMAKGESGYNSLNITDMNYQGTGKGNSSEPGKFDEILNGPRLTLNHQTNFGLLQMSPDRFRIHPKSSLEAMNRVFGQNAESLSALKPVEDEKFFTACATPPSLRGHDSFKNLGQGLAKAGAKFSVQGKGRARGTDLETLKYLGRLLAACPRLNIELASNEFEHTYRGRKGGLEYFETRKAIPVCQNEIAQFLRATPAPSTTVPEGQAGTQKPESIPTQQVQKTNHPGEIHPLLKSSVIAELQNNPSSLSDTSHTGSPLSAGPVVAQSESPKAGLSEDGDTSPGALTRRWNKYYNEGGSDTPAVFVRGANQDLDSPKLDGSRLQQIDERLKSEEKTLSGFNDTYKTKIVDQDLSALRKKVNTRKEEFERYNGTTDRALDNAGKAIGNFASAEQMTSHDRMIHDRLEAHYQAITQKSNGERLLRYSNKKEQNEIAIGLLTRLKKQKELLLQSMSSPGKEPGPYQQGLKDQISEIDQLLKRIPQ